jgi:hypothetical protein
MSTVRSRERECVCVCVCVCVCGLSVWESENADNKKGGEIKIETSNDDTPVPYLIKHKKQKTKKQQSSNLFYIQYTGTLYLVLYTGMNFIYRYWVPGTW